MVLIILAADATEKFPLSATRPTRAAKTSASSSVPSVPRKVWSSSGVETTLSSSSRSNWPGAGDRRGNHADDNSGEQVQEHGEHQREQHHQEVLALYVKDPRDEPPVYRVPSHLDQDAGQDGVGDRCNVPSQE